MSNRKDNKAPVFAQDQRLMFGQVREDAAVESWLLSRLKSPSRVFVIASGGCTAFALLSHNLDVVALDISKAQIALVELKHLLFGKLGFDATRAACIADARRVYDAVSQELSSESRDILDRIKDHLKGGLNNCGFIDRNMQSLLKVFYLFVHTKSHTEQFLSLDDPHRQKTFYKKNWCNLQWNLATSIAGDKRFLALIHGQTALDLVPDDFSQIIRNKFERALTEFPNSSNCYLWQTFFAKYPDSEAGFPLYLQRRNAEAITNNLSRLHLVCQDALAWFKVQTSGSLDMLALSNILELLPAEYVNQLMPEIIRCARSGALVCIRSIFPRRQPTFMDPTGVLVSDPQLAASAEAMDRSTFCNFFEIYRRL
ncbi:MAG: BtaA family protein [Candidatus Obscuribacterales bacterium]|nr:BtaA family protein [Candidatus Obscuribacterales bacterium]